MNSGGTLLNYCDAVGNIALVIPEAERTEARGSRAFLLGGLEPSSSVGCPDAQEHR